MRKLNWEEVIEPTTSTIMEPGAYEIKIQDVKDNERDEYLEIVYDIVSGPLAGKFNDATPDEDWKHQFRQSYSDKAMPFFKRFLKELEGDNPGFTIAAWQTASDPKALINLNLGMMFGEYRYLNGDGEAKWSLQASYPLTIEKVKAEEWNVPKPRYSQYTNEEEWTAVKNGATVSAGPSDSVYGDSIPF